MEPAKSELPSAVLPRDEPGSRPAPTRQPPPMRVVTKGWWNPRERKVDMDGLKKQVAEEV